jgi:amidase
MAIQAPSTQQIEEIAQDLGLHLGDEDLASYQGLLGALLGLVSPLDELPEELPPIRYPRKPGTRPSPEENRLNAWYVQTRIEGAPSGALQGRTVAVKDNVMVAGVQMMNGTTLLEGYIPPIDATIVTRILDAGGTIVGKAVCEAYCLSGGSHTSVTGAVRNPHNPEHSAGGSSSGSAALVAAGEVDLAIGCDQGGSIRLPAAYCGVYGMKPTHGLVPYTGILGFDPPIDHTGPITGSVADNALFLEVLAGEDGLDSRQRSPRVESYTQALGRGAEGLRIGIVPEGFGLPGSEADVEETVRAAAERLGRLGAKVSEVSVPIHRLGGMFAIATAQAWIENVLHADGCVIGRTDPLVVSYHDFHRGWRQRADELPETVKTLLLMTEFLRRQHGLRYYAKAVNRLQRLRAAYDEALEQVDLLLMPTATVKPPKLPPTGASREAIIAAAFSPTANTSAFNVTHHPAMSVPCGMREGLPVGMMLVGRHFEESTIYRAAHAFEQHADWRSL